MHCYSGGGYNLIWPLSLRSALVRSHGAAQFEKELFRLPSARTQPATNVFFIHQMKIKDL